MYSVQELYSNEINRRHLRAMLLYESNLLLNETMAIMNGEKLLEEEKNKNRLVTASPEEILNNWPYQHFTFARCRNVEYMKIGCSLELLLKSELLKKSIIIHKVKDQHPELRKKQNVNPISIEDDIISGEIMNFIDETKTIDLKILTSKQNYINIYDIPEALSNHFESLRKRRNCIHLPVVTIQGAAPDIFVTFKVLVYYVRDLKKYIEDEYNVITASGSLSNFPNINHK